MPDPLSLANPVFRTYIFFSSILVLKMMFMSAITGLRRLRIKSFVNVEDARFFGVQLTSDETIERRKRAHLNDMENIPLFFMAGFAYTLADPPQIVAKILFLIFTLTRIVHTIVYALWVVPQPSRVISWGIGYGITGYMAAVSAIHILNS